MYANLDSPLIPAYLIFIALFFGYIWFFNGDWEIPDSSYKHINSLIDNPLARPFIISAMEDGVITNDEYSKIKDSVSPRSILTSKLEVK
ncbi:hypothetical protein [Vibrio tarriae]|uniref:hypothetical protein n=1 Tax=Vibrio tarriae TaxID=2014742 RepID=UPI000DE3E77C|nr:hypothetical protein [Vibrio tarriae]RBM54069.1 hypothetical protein DLR64_05520 [Vibrio tarriae]